MRAGCLSVEVISLYVGSYLCFPLVSVVEELLLVVEQFFMGLSGKLKVRTLREREDGEQSEIINNKEDYHLKIAVNHH